MQRVNRDLLNWKENLFNEIVLDFQKKWLTVRKHHNRIFDTFTCLGGIDTIDKSIKNQGDRPALKIKQNNSINVRLTNRECKQIENKTQKAKLSPSDWLRKAAKKSNGTAAYPSPKDMHVLHVLVGMANNLNQLTKLSHTYGLHRL